MMTGDEDGVFTVTIVTSSPSNSPYHKAADWEGYMSMGSDPESQGGGLRGVHVYGHWPWVTRWRTDIDTCLWAVTLGHMVTDWEGYLFMGSDPMSQGDGLRGISVYGQRPWVTRC